MTWVRSDDSCPHHPKVVRAGAEAAWLWHSSICYSNAHRLNGKIAKDLLGTLYVPLASKAPRLAAVLVKVGLWHDRGDHYEIHDYAEYQEQALKESVKARREYERDRKRAQRGNARPGHVPDNVPDNVPGTNGPVPSVTRAIPSRPVPSRPVPEKVPEKEKIENARAPATPLTLVAAMAAGWNGTGLDAMSPKDRARLEHIRPAVEQLAKARGVSPATLWSEAADRFKKHPDTLAKRLGLPVFVTQFEQWTHAEIVPPYRLPWVAPWEKEGGQ